MKKLLAIFAVAALISCNDSADGDNKNGDSAANKIDSSYDSKIDSVQNRADSIIDKLDSTKDAKVDNVRGKLDSADKK